MKTTISNYLSLCILAALSSGSQLVMAQEQVAQNAEMETIQVRGIRGSLKEALNSKRFANSVIDSVSAEDIGKFPDKNIGDAMQRIPGVTVVRTYGEVSGVTVRGTAPEHSMVLLNGQNVASVGWFDLGGINRSFNFEMLAAEQISGMDLYKSVEADINEGAMGGTVDLKTRSPLAMDSGTVYASVEGGYSEGAEEWSPAYSGLVSWKNDDETFGILVAHSVEESRVYRETLTNFGLPNSTSFVDSNGGAHVGYGAMSSIVFDEERERSSSQLTIEYSPTDELSFALDYHLFELDNDHINSALFAVVGFGELDGNSVIDNSYGVVTRGTSEGSGPGYAPLFNNTVLRTPKMETDSLNISMDYKTDSWAMNAVIGRSDAEGRTKQSSTWWGDTADIANAGFTYDVAGPLELFPTNSAYLESHNNFLLFHEFTYLTNVRDNEIDYYQIDFSYELDKGIFTTLETGLKYQEQLFSAYVDNRDVDITDAVNQGMSLADYNGGFVSGLHGEEGRAGSTGRFPIGTRGLWQYGATNQASESIITSDFSVEEDITAAYVKANFEGEGFRGNVGLRLVDTDVLSKGRIDGEPAQGKSDYTNYLPSVNLVADVTEDLLFRFAAGSTVSRPDYQDMQMAETISVSFGTAVVGSPDLEPYKSDQYDLGLEWYFNEASVLGATFFVKNISDYIETTTATENYPGCSETCLVTRSRNVGTADVTGIELQFQQDFGNGFGVQANYTYTDSEVTNSAGKTVPIDEVSRNSYNLSGYYENDLFSARLAYNARDKWRRQYNNSGSGSVNADYDQLDASVVWHVTENIDVSVEAVNILNETLKLDQPDFGNVVHSVDEFGARYYVGASINF